LRGTKPLRERGRREWERRSRKLEKGREKKTKQKKERVGSGRQRNKEIN
jgi:hypothetical protein